MPETAKRTARVPILGKDGRISDDYIPSAIDEGVESAEAAAKRAETAATNAEGSATAAGQSATKAQEGATAAGNAKTAAETAQKGAESAKTEAETAKEAAEAAKTGAESAQSAAAGSAQDAQQSATAAQQSAASVADKFISSAQATTLDPGSQATASVENQVLTIGVPKGEKGDKGDQGEKGDTGTGVPDGGTPGQLLSKTDSGTAWVDPPSGNVLTGEAEGYIAHADDAYAQKPSEVRIKGKTWVNRWPALSGTHNGITVATDGTGLVTVTGTATADADVTADVSGWAAGRSYTTMVSATPTGYSAYFEVQKPSGNTSINATTTGATLNVASDATNCVAGVHVTSGTTVNASFRVMLVDGTEAPDCFTPPASIASVETGKLVTVGKNLLPESDEQTQPIYLEPGTYVFSADFDSDGGKWYLHSPDDIFDENSPTLLDGKSFTIPYAGNWIIHRYGITASNAQIELGSTATAYEPPTVTQTPLPEVELRSLPNGTCDELVVKADGTCEVERNVTEYEVQGTETISVGEHSNGQKYALVGGIAFSSSSSSLLSDRYSCGAFGITDKYAYVPDASTLVINDSRFIDNDTAKSILASEKPRFVFVANSTTEPQSPVTLPELPAPTFNQYHDSPVPSDTSTEYVRDINIVLDNLAKQVAGTASAVAVREASTIEEE